MQIRDEKPDEHSRIHQLIQEAFASAEHADGNEGDIVDGLRAANALSLSLVAEEAGQLIGHLGSSPVDIGNHAHLAWYGIAPVSVLPARQRQGVGSALMEEAVNRLRNMGASGALLVGDPAYYGRFEFKPIPGFTVPGIPNEYVLARPFEAVGGTGPVKYHKAFGLPE